MFFRVLSLIQLFRLLAVPYRVRHGKRYSGRRRKSFSSDSRLKNCENNRKKIPTIPIRFDRSAIVKNSKFVGWGRRHGWLEFFHLINAFDVYRRITTMAGGWNISFSRYNQPQRIYMCIYTSIYTYLRTKRVHQTISIATKPFPWYSVRFIVFKLCLRIPYFMSLIFQT